MYSHFLSRFSISQSSLPQTKILNSRLVKFTITDHWLDRSCQLLIDSFLKVAPRYEVHPSFFIQKHIQDPGSLMNIKFKVSMSRLSQVRFLHRNPYVRSQQLWPSHASCPACVRGVPSSYTHVRLRS